MNKNKIKEDSNFRSHCAAYGIDGNEFNLYKDIIILNSPKKDISIFFDEDYNTIGIHKFDHSDQTKSIEEYATKYRDSYNNADNNGLNLAYPFQNLSLKQIVELAKRITIYNDIVIVNNKFVIDDYYNVYLSLLSYIEVLRILIEQYFFNAYQMKVLGFAYPEVHSYLKSIMLNIEECIDMYIAKKTRPLPIDVIKYLGQDKEIATLCKSELDKMIELLLNEKGFKGVYNGERYREIATFDKCEMDLSLLSLNT